MITPLTGLPQDVLGFDVGEEVTTKDYDEVIGPAIRTQAQAGKGVRAVVRVAQRPSMSAGAV
ncbi:MAG: hypothetical protein P8M11_03005 [Planctomycetota bacterium]|nr:hypothetical protein [Planctomycetota bacterium]MDG1983511.1 hypothetical protein [Planctomycetota bacterium]